MMKKILAVLAMTTFVITGCSLEASTKVGAVNEDPASYQDIKKHLTYGQAQYIEKLQKEHMDDELAIQCYMGMSELEKIKSDSTDENLTCKGIESNGRESSTSYLINELLGINTRIETYNGDFNDSTLLLLENGINLHEDTEQYRVSQSFFKTSLTLLTGANQRFKNISSTQSDRAPGLAIFYDASISEDIIQEYKTTVFPSTLHGYNPSWAQIPGIPENYDRFCKVEGEPTDYLSILFTNAQDKGCYFMNPQSKTLLNLLAEQPEYYAYLTTNEKYSKYIAEKTNVINTGGSSFEDPGLSSSLMLASTNTQIYTRSRKLVTQQDSKHEILIDIIDKLLSIDEIYYKANQKSRSTKVYASKQKVAERLQNIYGAKLTSLPTKIKWTTPPFTKHAGVTINDKTGKSNIFGPYADLLASLAEIYNNIEFEYVDMGSDATGWEDRVRSALTNCNENNCELNIVLPYVSYNELSVSDSAFESKNLGDNVAMNFYTVDRYITHSVNADSKIYTVKDSPYYQQLISAKYKKENITTFDTIYDTLMAAKRDKVFVLGSPDWQLADLGVTMNYNETLTRFPIKIASVKYNPKTMPEGSIQHSTEVIATTFYDLHDNLYVMSGWHDTFDAFISSKAAKYQQITDTKAETQQQFIIMIVTGGIIATIWFSMRRFNKVNKMEREKLELIDTTIKSDTSISLMTLDMIEKQVLLIRGDIIERIFNGKVFPIKDFINYFGLNATQFMGMLAAASSKENNDVVITTGEGVSKNIRHFSVSAHLHKDNKHATVALRDITDEVNEKEKLKERVERDELTGLYSRTSYVNKIKNLISYNLVTRGFLAFMDINDFKDVNDKYGHKVGDKLLKIFARTLKDSVKHIEGNILVRISGDEFLMFIPNVLEAEAKKICEDLVKKLDQPLEVETLTGEGKIKIKAKPSLGYAMYGTDTKDLDKLTHFADYAMYKAKQHKHTQTLPVHKFNMDEYVAETKVKIETKFLREAIRDKSFIAIFQPIIEIATGKVYGYEALSRPGITSLPNIGRCMELANDIWQLKPLTRVLTEVITKTWLEKGNDRRIFINEPPFLVYDKGDVNHVYELADKIGKDKIIIEITEQFSFKSGDLTTKFETLKAAGIDIAIDDFGSGHANMLMFETVHPKIVKIDRALLKDIDKDQKRKRTVEYLIKFINSSGMISLAEGIETIEEFEVVKNAGANLVQGYLFGKPNPEVTLEAEERFARITRGQKVEDEVIAPVLQQTKIEYTTVMQKLDLKKLTEEEFDAIHQDTMAEGFNLKRKSKDK